MSNFEIFFPEGIKHITDLNGIDHILFVTALCLRYLLSDWKKLLILITAFTLGHSITLALSTLRILDIPRNVTEFLIAATILITALHNIFFKENSNRSRFPIIYIYALFFGLIHGLGFSTLLISMLGKDENIIIQLFAFNLGLEIGQLIIVAIILTISFIFVRLLKISQRDFILVISGAIIALSLEMAIQRFPYKKNDSNNEKAVLQHRFNSNDYGKYCARHSQQS